MATDTHHSGNRTAFSGGIRLLIGTALWLAWLNHAGLQAQARYSTASGTSTSYAFYAPPNPPVTKAPAGPALAPYTQGALPVVSASQYAAIQAAIEPYARSSFSSLPQVQFSGIMARAPSTTGGPVALIPTESFPGIQEPPGQQTQPPSPDIAAGPSDVVLVVNSYIAQYTKAGTQVQLTALQDFFASLLPVICPTGVSNCQIFDPLIRYDQLHGRFLLLASSRTLDLSVSYNLIAVTNGATYDSGWKIWALNAALDGATPTGNWADFWRLGFDNRAVYLAGNLYNSSSFFQYAKIRVLLKSDLYNQAATSLPYQDVFKLMNADGSLADSIIPVHQRGKPSAANSQLLVNATNFNLPATYLTVWKIVDPTANPVAVAATTVTGLLPYTVPAPARQPNYPATLDAGDARILKAVYRDGFLYTARDTGYTDAATTVTYDVIDTSGMTLVSQARLLNTNSFYPAFDVPATVPAGVNFASPNSVSACPWCITGTTTAPDGSATYAGISDLMAGQGIFDLTGGLPQIPNRWGDYFGGAVDPVSGGLWASGEYAAAPQTGAGVTLGFAGVWGTWAGYFPWATAPAFTDVTQPFDDYANVLSLWGITTGCTATTFCPTTTITRGQIATFIIRSMNGDPCPNNTPCTGGFTYTAAPYFTDVLAADSDFPYVQKLRDLGITSGCTATTFCPNDMVPRWAAAVLIVRGKLKSLAGDAFTYPSTPSFEDVAPSSSTFPYIQKLFELGITSGCTATTFCPDDLITRQQAAVFIVRAFLN